MAAPASASGPHDERHHAVPQCLLTLRDRADAHEEFDGEGIQRWLDYELEALRWGIDPDNSREELEALRAGYAEMAGPVCEGQAEAARLEQQLSYLVNEAYGLTPEEVALLWATAPPRMPKL